MFLVVHQALAAVFGSRGCPRCERIGNANTHPDLRSGSCLYVRRLPTGVGIIEGERHTPLPPKKLSERLYFVDNLRTYIIVLVVLHHLAIVYGTGYIFYYVEPAYNDALASIVLPIFIAINQAYFMGLLFLISGYFSPGSLDRKGPTLFVKDRLIRLGIPLVVFYFVLNPIASLGLNYGESPIVHIATPLTWQDYPKLVGFGPIWFIAMLLIFDIGFAIWCVARRNRPRPNGGTEEPPRYRTIAVFIIVLAVATYLIRIAIPLDKFVAGFPTISYLPQYLSFFIVGTVAVRHNWFRAVPKSMGRVGLRACARRDDHALSPRDSQRRHKLLWIRHVAICSLRTVGLDGRGGNVPRAHHVLPRTDQLVRQFRPILAATLVHCLHNPISHHCVCRRCTNGTLARAPAQVRPGGGDHSAALFRNRLSGVEDPICVARALTVRALRLLYFCCSTVCPKKARKSFLLPK